MKMIEVLDLMAKGEIKEGTILKFVDSCNETVSYIYDEEMNAFYDEAQYDLGSEEEIRGPFLNKKVELIQPKPKPKKYYLKLDEDDSFSYINLTMYAAYEAATKDEFFGYKTKFTQEEIDGSMLLKFIEQHGIKEAVEE